MTDSRWTFSFITEAHESVRVKDVVGIAVDGNIITDVRCRLRSSYDQAWINQQSFNHVGQQVMIKCHCRRPIAVPVRQSVSLVFHAIHAVEGVNNGLCAVPSWTPVHIINNSNLPDRIGVCLGVLRGTPNTLHSFLEHYRQLGVDVIMMYTTHEFWRSYGGWIKRWSRSSRQRVRVYIWPAFFPTHSFSQQLAYLDCSMHRDEFKYILQVDSDDFLVDRDLEIFNLREYLRQKEEVEKGRCAVWLSTWLEVTPPDEGKFRSLDCNDALNQSRELPITCRRREYKIIYDPSCVRSLGVHWATVQRPSDICKTNLKSIHATFRDTPPHRCRSK